MPSREPSTSDIEHISQMCKRLSVADQDTSLIERSVQITLSRSENVACFLPLAVNRDLAYIVPAMLDPGATTIVFGSYSHIAAIPTYDGVEYGHWGDKNATHPTILFVSTQSALTPEFAKYLKKLIDTQSLARIVFESCHDILRLSDMSIVVATILPKLPNSIQIVLSSSIMPVEAQNDLFARVSSINPRINPFTIVRSTGLTRDGVTFVKTRLDNCERDSPALITFLIDIHVQAHGQCHAVVYTLSQKHAVELANTLGYDVCHERMPAPQKADVLATWKSEKGVVVISNGSSADVDYRGVDLVIHVGHPPDTFNYVCNVYEASHNSGKVVSHVIWSEPDLEGESTGVRRLSSILGGTECIKAALRCYTDGTDAPCGLEDRCSVCRVSGQETSAHRFANRTDCLPTPQSSQELTVHLRSICILMSGICTSCWFQGRFNIPISNDHTSFSCPVTNLTDAQTPQLQSPDCTYKTFMRSIEWIPGWTCYMCYAPFNRYFHPHLEDGVTPVCDYRDTVGTGIYAAFAWYRPLLLQRFGTEIEAARDDGEGELATWARWLGLIGAGEMTNAVHVFIWLFEYIAGGGTTRLEAGSS